jgi:NAD-dependent DNA ligase
MKQDALRRENIKSGKINMKIRGKVFVTTGFYGHMDLDIGDYIYDHMGNFSDTVTSMTEAVIAANLLDVSKKMTEAQNLKVPVLSMEEFLKKYDINIKKGEDEEEGDDKDILLDPENEEGE